MSEIETWPQAAQRIAQLPSHMERVEAAMDFLDGFHHRNPTTSCNPYVLYELINDALRKRPL